MTFVIVIGFHQIIVVMNDVKRHTYIHTYIHTSGHKRLQRLAKSFFAKTLDVNFALSLLGSTNKSLESGNELVVGTDIVLSLVTTGCCGASELATGSKLGLSDDGNEI